MEIDPLALDRMPPISDILDENRISKAEIIRMMRWSDDPVIVKFFDSYDALPIGDRDRVPLEALILKADVSPVHFLGSMQLVVRENSVARVKMMAMTSHPEVMQKRIEFAMLAGGVRDRDALDTMLGALPSNKGINIFQRFVGMQPDGKPDPQTPVEEMERDANFVFPDSNRMQEKLTPIRQKMLQG